MGKEEISIASFSIITHVYNQNRHLKHFLRGLEKSGFSDELVLVVIGGEDPFEILSSDLPFSIKTIYMEKNVDRLPICQAKNIGAWVAQGDALIFLDVNQIPSKSLLSAYESALSQEPDTIHTGRKMILSKTPHKNWSFRYLQKHCVDHAPQATERHMRALSNEERFNGHNFAIRKQIFESLKGFDENYKGSSADIDFYFTAKERALEIKYNHFALSYELGSGRGSKKNQDIDSLSDNTSIFYAKWGKFPSRGARVAELSN